MNRDASTDTDGEGTCFVLPRHAVTNRDFGPKPPLTEADPAAEIPERERIARELYPHLPNRYPVEWDQLPRNYVRRLLTAVEKVLLSKLVALRHQVNALVQDKNDLCRRLLVAEHESQRSEKLRHYFEECAFRLQAELDGELGGNVLSRAHGGASLTGPLAGAEVTAE